LQRGLAFTLKGKLKKTITKQNLVIAVCFKILILKIILKKKEKKRKNKFVVA